MSDSIFDRQWSPYDLARALHRAIFAEEAEAVQAFTDELISGDKEMELLHGFTVRDLRDAPRNKDKFGKSLKRGRAIGMRRWDEIDGVCDHQTGAPVSEDHYRLLAVPAHSHVARSSVITLLNPCAAYMQHAVALNRTTIGVEYEADTEDGLYPTDRQLEAGVALHRYYAAKIRRMRELPDFQPGLYVHRQSDSWRENDPGLTIARHNYHHLVRSGLYRDVTDKSYRHHKGKKRHGMPWPEEWKREIADSEAAA